MTKIEIQIGIERPPEEVFAYISNPENNPLWQGGMIDAQVTSEGPLAIGSTYKQVAKFMGREVNSHFEITAFEPGRLITGKTVSSTFPITFTRIVEPSTTGSHVSAIIEGGPQGIMRIFRPLMDRMVQRSIDGDYANLKRILER